MPVIIRREVMKIVLEVITVIRRLIKMGLGDLSGFLNKKVEIYDVLIVFFRVIVLHLQTKEA